MKVILMAPTPPPYGGIAAWTNRMLGLTLPNDWTVELVDEKVSLKRGNYSERRNLFEELARSIRIWHGLRRKLKDKNAKVVHCCIPATPFAMLRKLVSASAKRSRLCRRDCLSWLVLTRIRISVR